MEIVIAYCTLAALVCLLVALVAGLVVLSDDHERLIRIEKALRERNEALTSAIAARPHVRAFSGAPPEPKPGAKLSVTRVNWDRPQ